MELTDNPYRKHKSLWIFWRHVNFKMNTLPIYPGLRQAPNMLACILGDKLIRYLTWVNRLV